MGFLILKGNQGGHEGEGDGNHSQQGEGQADQHILLVQKLSEIAVFELPLFIRLLLQFRHIDQMTDMVEGVPLCIFLGYFIEGFTIFRGDEVLLFSVFRNRLKF